MPNGTEQEIAVLKAQHRALEQRTDRLEDAMATYVRDVKRLNTKVDAIARDLNGAIGGAKWLAWGVGTFLGLVSIGVAIIALFN